MIARFEHMCKREKYYFFTTVSTYVIYVDDFKPKFLTSILLSGYTIVLKPSKMARVTSDWGYYKNGSFFL